MVTKWWPNGEQVAASCCQNVNSSEKWKVATKVVDGRVADVHCRMANGGIASTPLRFWRFGHFEMETEWSNRRHSMPWISHEFPMNRLGIDWMTVIDSIQLDSVIDWIVLWIGQRTTKANSLAANPSCLLHPPNRHNHKMIQPKPKLFDFFPSFLTASDQSRVERLTKAKVDWFTAAQMKRKWAQTRRQIALRLDAQMTIGLCHRPVPTVDQIPIWNNIHQTHLKQRLPQLVNVPHHHWSTGNDCVRRKGSNRSGPMMRFFFYWRRGPRRPNICR